MLPSKLGGQMLGVQASMPVRSGLPQPALVNYASTPVLPSLPSGQIPFNVKFRGVDEASQYDALLQVSRANNKILYEDPLERKRREREIKI